MQIKSYHASLAKTEIIIINCYATAEKDLLTGPGLGMAGQAQLLSNFLCWNSKVHYSRSESLPICSCSYKNNILKISHS